jgi:hypothetical protein
MDMILKEILLALQWSHKHIHNVKRTPSIHNVKRAKGTHNVKIT